MSMYEVTRTRKLWVVPFESGRKQERQRVRGKSPKKEILDMNCVEDKLWPDQLSCKYL